MGRGPKLKSQWQEAWRAARAELEPARPEARAVGPGARPGGTNSNSQVAPGRSAGAKASRPLPETSGRVGRAPGSPTPPSVAPKIPPTAVSPPVLQKATPVVLRKVGPFRPNPLLVIETSSADVTRLVPANDGVAGDLLEPSEAPQDERDLILGLDFGTSSVKAVIRDRFMGRAFAVPFTMALDNPYLLPSRAYRTGDRYSLDCGDRALRDLKLGLLGCAASSPVGEFNDACAFLSLVIRHCRGWLLDTHAALYRGVRIYWSLNLGLPAASYEAPSAVNLFRRLAWAASNVAAQPGEVTYELCEEFRQLSREAFTAFQQDEESTTGFDIEFRDVDVVPEVAAQIYGYVTGSKWDWRERPMMLLVDVGAGTVDSAFFSYTNFSHSGKRFSFFANKVEPNGAMNLHRARVDWLARAAGASAEAEEVVRYLGEIRAPTDRTAPIPESFLEYVPGYEVHCRQGEKDVDASFFQSRYYRQVSGCCMDAWRTGIKTMQLKSVPCFLTGGGSRLRFYREVIDSITDNAAAVTLEWMPLTRNVEDLVSPGLADADFDRLSVAYGLSLHGADGKSLGTVMRAIKVERPATAPTKDWSVNLVTKDMV